MEELVFLKLKQTLAQGLALALPNVTKQFHLYTCKEHFDSDLETLAKALSVSVKHLDLVVSYCPSCFHTIALITILIHYIDNGG